MRARLSQSLSVGLCVIAAGCFLIEVARAVPPLTLENYECQPNGDCSAVSRKCWGAGHEWGASYCTYCNGANQASFCARSVGGQCVTSTDDTTLPCGQKVSGSCSGGPIGECYGIQVIHNKCEVPQCN